MPNDWPEIISRISVPGIIEIEVAKPGKPVPDSFPEPADMLPPPALLWPRQQDGSARFGIRVEQAPANIHMQAMRLAAIAVERTIFPVILSHVPRSGFEQAGFRVERIHAGTRAEAQAQEAEICRFWDLPIVIDLKDIAALG